MHSADASALDGVTVDAFGTLLALEDPVPALQEALAAHGFDRDAETVRAAFLAEAAFYRPRSLEGRDDATLGALRVECVEVFLAEAEAETDPAGFVPAFMDAVAFRPIDGAVEALDRLRAAGLSLACVANWDVSLHEHLDRAGLTDRFTAIVASAAAGAAKPDPRIFHLALERLAVSPDRALHIGDEEVDRAGAIAAGLRFEPVPLATLPERIGL